MRKIVIALICHTNGQFSVGRDPGTGRGIKVLASRQEADAYAKRLQAEAGGPDNAEIIVHDLSKDGMNEDYPYIRAYGILHGWSAKAVAEVIRKARNHEAPQTAIFHGKPNQPRAGWRWFLFDELSEPDQNKMLAEITLGL